MGMTVGYFPHAEISEPPSGVGLGNRMARRLAVDDFKYLSGANKIEQLLHWRSGIDQAYCAVPAAG